MNKEQNHREYQDLLYAYSHDLLLASDRERLELHLAECSECFERAMHIAQLADFINGDKDARQVIDNISSEESAGPQADRALNTPKRFLTYPKRLTVVAALIIALFILKPWDLQFSSTNDIMASPNRLAILHFDNIRDPEDTLAIGQTIAHMLATDLSESSPVQVVSPARIAGLYRLFENREIELDGKDFAAEVAERVDARYVLSGAILHVDSSIVLTVQLMDRTSDTVMMSRKVLGQPSETMFELVDRLTVHVHDALASVMPVVDESRDLCIADITTNSAKSYMHYIRGLDMANRMYRLEAAKQFHISLKYDSTFALAWYQLWKLEGGAAIDRAVQYSDQVSRKEQRQIMIAKQFQQGARRLAVSNLRNMAKDYPDDVDPIFDLASYEYAEEHYDSAIIYFEKCIEIDSLYKQAYNSLAYAYDKIGDFEEAIRCLDMYAEVAPEEPNPQDSKGDLYAQNGLLRDAITFYRRAFEIDPMFFVSLFKAGHMWLYIGEPDSALATYRSASSHQLSEARSLGRLCSSYPFIVQGRFNEALKVLDEGIREDSTEGRIIEQSLKHLAKGTIHEAQHKLLLALSEARQTVKLNHSIDSTVLTLSDLYLGLVLVKVDSLGEALSLMEQFESQRKKSPRQDANYLVLKAHVQKARGEYEEARKSMEEAGRKSSQFLIQYLLGLTWIESQNYDNAIDLFEAQRKNPEWWRAQWSAFDLQMYYYLALAYEETDRISEAISAYQAFLDMCSEADPGFALVVEAQRRLTRLQEQTP